MSFASESGYTPQTVPELMALVMAGVNAQFGTAYTPESFIGTNFYKFYYALIQRLQENEVKTGEIVNKLRDYFAVTNERIARPVGTNPGLIEAFAKAGFVASIKPPVEADAGKLFVAVDVNNLAAGYAAKKLQINTLLKNSHSAGIVTMGDQVNTIVLTNGQSFDFKFYLPVRYPTKLKLTITTSANNQYVIQSPDEIKAFLLARIKAMYSLGKNFEPQKYYTSADAPWAQSVKLEWSIDNGATWSTAVNVASYRDLFTFSLADTEVVQL